MSYVDGLSGVLSQIGQIQSTMASLPTTAPGDFASVLAQVSAVPQAMGTPLVAGSSAGYGFPLEEGADIYPSTAAPSQLGPLSSTGPSSSGTSSSLGGTSTVISGIDRAVTAAPRVFDVRTLSKAVTAAGAGSAGPAPSAAASSASTAGIGQAAVAEAQKFLGVPYLWGGTSPTQGVDCSGLVQDVYSEVGISLPRTSQEQATAGVPVADLSEAQPGDLVFYPGSDGTASAPGHVGIYLGHGQMIDAPYTGADVRVDPVGNPTSIRRVSGLSNAGPSGSSTPAAVASGSTSANPPAQSQAAPGTSPALTGPYAAQFANASATYGVPENLLKAVASTESAFEPGAVSSAGAEGIMQLMPAVASSLGVDPFDPSQAIGAAARLLSSYHTQFGSWPLALAAYNAGPGAVQEHAGVPPFSQTTAYVSSVLAKAGMEQQ